MGLDGFTIEKDETGWVVLACTSTRDIHNRYLVDGYAAFHTEKDARQCAKWLTDEEHLLRRLRPLVRRMRRDAEEAQKVLDQMERAGMSFLPNVWRDRGVFGLAHELISRPSCRVNY